MCSKQQKKTVDNLFNFGNVMPVENIFELNVLCLKYFDEHHGVPRLHQYNTRMSKIVPVIMPPSVNKYID